MSRRPQSYCPSPRTTGAGVGITEGSDVGDAGEKEVEVEPFGRFGTRTGTYAATSTSVLAKYTPIDNFRFASGFSLSSRNISNVPDLPNANQFRWEAVNADSATACSTASGCGSAPISDQSGAAALTIRSPCRRAKMASTKPAMVKDG